MSQVAEKIFLRQQNQELRKRWKVASQDLKRLPHATTPLARVIQMDEFRKVACEQVGPLFASDHLKYVWWKKESNQWKRMAASTDGFPECLNSRDEVDAFVKDWQSPKVLD